MSWQEEFDEALKSFGPIPDEVIEYRLHYDSGGNIIMCSMQQHPDSVDYIVVDRETYENYTKYRVNVEKKRLIKIDINPGVSIQLKRSNQGFAVVKHHAGILLELSETYPNIEYYEANY